MKTDVPVLPFTRVPGLRVNNDSETTCGYCRHFNSVPPDGANLKAPPHGLCRRYPPQVVPVMQQTPQGPAMGLMPMNPVVSADHTCGEFERTAPTA